MDEKRDYGKYEFNAHENEVLLILSKDLHKLGLLIFTAGLLFAIYLIVSYYDPAALVPVSETKAALLNALDYGLWIVIALMVIYLSAMVVRLAKPVRLIVETSGADMANLMEFLKELIRMVRICASALVVACALMGVSLLLLIAVF